MGFSVDQELVKSSRLPEQSFIFPCALVLVDQVVLDFKVLVEGSLFQMTENEL